MTDKKTEFTPEEEALIPVYYKKYLDQQTEQASLEDIHEAIEITWKALGLEKPEIILCDSPDACRNACPDVENYDTYWSTWFASYAAMYDFADRIGLEMDQDKLKAFLLWGNSCPFILFNEDRVYVSKSPISLHFNDNRQLHNDSGMSCEFSDGWGIWNIDGVSVDEQIVMRPETQTIDQIRKEENEEIKRVRMNQYGIQKYMKEINAKRLGDRRRNDIEGTVEYLYQADDAKFLLCVCPSTQKEFCLEVSDDVNTPEEAQRYISSGLSDRIISAS